MNKNGLNVEGIVKQYHGFQLGPVTFYLHPGRAYGLLGPNGAGKTTLLNCLAGQSRPGAGSFRWNGRRIRWDDWRYREEISFVRETTTLYDELSVAQTLRFASCVYANWDARFAEEWRERLKLEHKQRVGNLSRGMKVKLSIIAGLAHGARLLLLDEPTVGLDPDSRVEIQGLLRGLTRERGACLLVSSHLFEDMDLVCDEIIIIREGKIVRESSIRDGENKSAKELYFESE